MLYQSVEENNRGKQMGYVYFSWLLGLLVGMVVMNLLIKVHPTHFAFMMSLVLIAWVLYYFVNIQLTNYNTKPVSEQLKQIVDVTNDISYYFLGYYWCSNFSISAYTSKYATKVIKVSTVEYTIAIIIGYWLCIFNVVLIKDY